MSTDPRIAVSRQIGHVYITPGGTHIDMRRINEYRDGVQVQTNEMADEEVRAFYEGVSK